MNAVQPSYLLVSEIEPLNISIEANPLKQRHKVEEGYNFKQVIFYPES